MSKIITKIIIILILIVLFCLTAQSDNKIFSIVSSIVSILLGIFIQDFFNILNTQGQGIKIWFQSKVRFREKVIRLSFAYLFRIEVDGKYLLVRGHRMRDRYQPIGGVYKYYPEAKPFLNSISYANDVKMGNSDETDDLRIRIKGKHLMDFYQWFLSMKDREYDPKREFYEELIATKLLPEEKFRHIKYRKIRCHNIGITWSRYNNIHEVVYADIFDVTLNEKQKEFIRKAVEDNPEDLVLVTLEELNSRRCSGSVHINLGNNVSWLIGDDSID